jgi:hypothetical protein
LYIDQERVDDAYEHAMAVEKIAAYSTSLEWYQYLIEVLEVRLACNRGSKVHPYSRKFQQSRMLVLGDFQSSMLRDENFLGIPGNPCFSSDFRGFPEWVFGLFPI